MPTIKQTEQNTRHFSVEGEYYIASMAVTNGLVTKIFVRSLAASLSEYQFSNVLGGITPSHFFDLVEVFQELEKVITANNFIPKETGLSLDEDMETEEVLGQPVVTEPKA
jgi:hypothetical protein